MAGIEVVELGGASLAEALQHTGAFLKALDGSPKTLVLNVTAERLGDVGRFAARAAKDVPRLGILIHGGCKRPGVSLRRYQVRAADRAPLCASRNNTTRCSSIRATPRPCTAGCAPKPRPCRTHTCARQSRLSAQSLLCGRLVALAPALQSLTYLDTQWCNQRFDQSPALGLAMYSGNVSATDGRWRQCPGARGPLRPRRCAPVRMWTAR